MLYYDYYTILSYNILYHTILYFNLLRLETLARIAQFEFSSSNVSIRAVELILLLNLNKQFPIEQFEATVSQSTVPSPLLSFVCWGKSVSA